MDETPKEQPLVTTEVEVMDQLCVVPFVFRFESLYIAFIVNTAFPII